MWTFQKTGNTANISLEFKLQWLIEHFNIEVKKLHRGDLKVLTAQTINDNKHMNHRGGPELAGALQSY